MHDLRAAAIQLSAGDDVADNWRRAVPLVRQAADEGANLIVLPEFFACYGPFARIVGAAEPIPGPRSHELAALARELGIVLCAGSMPEAIAGSKRIHNTSLIFLPDGSLAGRYRKRHCFDVSLPEITTRESDHVAAGDEALVVEAAGAKLGVAICYDLRFPEHFRLLADRGVEILLLPSAFLERTGRDHWEVLVRARAMENQAFVIAANQTGQHSPHLTSFGHSLIVDPWGRILAEQASGEGIVSASLSATLLSETRRTLPALKHRRTHP